MAADSAPERLRPRWVQVQALAALVHQVLALPAAIRAIDKFLKLYKKYKKVMV